MVGMKVNHKEGVLYNKAGEAVLLYNLKNTDIQALYILLYSQTHHMF